MRYSRQEAHSSSVLSTSIHSALDEAILHQTVLLRIDSLRQMYCVHLPEEEGDIQQPDIDCIIEIRVSSDGYTDPVARVLIEDGILIAGVNI
jgi:hypothetical protein